MHGEATAYTSTLQATCCTAQLSATIYNYQLYNPNTSQYSLQQDSKGFVHRPYSISDLFYCTASYTVVPLFADQSLSFTVRLTAV